MLPLSPAEFQIAAAIDSWQTLRQPAR